FSRRCAVRQSRHGQLMRPAALGFRVHSGWTAAVAVTGPADAPSVAVRRRVELVSTFTYTFRQPYHTAEKMPLQEPARFIHQCQTDARRLALSALRTVEKELARMNVKMGRCGLLLASGRPLPALESILASHALIHTADGELFRNAIAQGCERCAIALERVKEGELLSLASESLRLRPQTLQRRIADLGRGLGPPWGQDEKLSALVAWLSLVHRR